MSKRIGYLGLVAGMCDEIGLTRLVDQMIPLIPPDQRAESAGECLKLMIINAIGFAARPLYLEAGDFSQRPLKHLPGRNVSAKKITDDRLGRTLDRLYEAECDRYKCNGLKIRSRVKRIGRGRPKIGDPGITVPRNNLEIESTGCRQ